MATKEEIQAKAANLTPEQQTAIKNQVSAMKPEELEARVQKSVENPTQSPVVAPVEPSPVETPTQVTEPKLFAEPVKEVKAPVQTTQAPVMSQKEEFELGESKKQVTQQERQAKLDGFRNLLEENADRAEMARYVNENPDLRTQFGLQAKNFYKTKQNADFQMKYASASPKALYDAYINSDIVVGSAEYNMLPPETKSAFEQYKAQKDIVMTQEELQTSLANDKKKVLETPAIKEPVFAGTDITEKYNKLINAPEITAKRTEVEGLATELAIKAQEIKDVQFDVESEFLENKSGRSGDFVKREIYRKTRLLQKEYDRISVQYQKALAGFQDMKSDIEREMKYVEFEEERAFQNYQIQLRQYNADRSRMDAFAMAEFERKNNEIALQKQQEFQREMLKNQQEFQLTNKQGDYFDDGNGNMVYVVDGEVKGQLNGLGSKISTQATDDYTFESFEANDGTITTIIRNKKTGQINSDVRNVNGDKPGDYFNSLGNGKITGYGGVYDNNQGLDIDGNVGDPVYAPFDGEIIESQSHPMYGNTIVVQDSVTGNKIRYSHLDSSMLNNVGTKFESGAVIAALGNSGNVLKMDGTKPTKAELKAGFGSHLDIVTYDENGRPRSSRETEEYLKSLGNNNKELETYNSAFGPLYAKFNSDKSLTAADWDAIPNTEQFMKEAEIYGKEKAIPGYQKIEDLIGLAESLKGLGPIERKLPDNAVDVNKILGRAGMQELIDLKSQGATFGSLTEKEFERIQSSVLNVGALTSADKWNEILDDYIVTLKRGLPSDYTTNTVGETTQSTGNQVFSPTSSGFNYTPSTSLDPAITSFYNQ